MTSIKDYIEYYHIIFPSCLKAILSAKNNIFNKLYQFPILNMILSPAGR
jgi:hypothetical protein